MNYLGTVSENDLVDYDSHKDIKITCKNCKHCYRPQGVKWGVNSCWGYRCEKRGVISPIPVRPDYSCPDAEKRKEE